MTCTSGGTAPRPGSVPPEFLDLLFEPGSPFRPGEGLDLGRTPVAPLRVPMGSYLAIVAHDDFHPVRVPISVERSAEENVVVTLYRRDEIPAGYVQVPGGVPRTVTYRTGGPPAQVFDAYTIRLAAYPVLPLAAPTL